MPKDHRPKLLLYGESLGATGSEGAFDDLADVRNTADGVVWAGPPDSNRIWGDLVAKAGSQELSARRPHRRSGGLPKRAVNVDRSQGSYEFVRTLINTHGGHHPR